MPNRDKRGMILFIVIAIIMVVVILSTVILTIIANHSRLTHHMVSRIQAQYAAKAGVIYALDKLRRNDDSACVSAGGWIMKSSGPAACVIIEPNLPRSVLQVDITVSGAPGTQKVSAKATYDDTPY